MNQNNNFNASNIPQEYKPLGMWTYFGYSILYSLPVIGFIMVLVFSFGGTSNINLRNYSRSFLCSLIIATVIIVVMIAIVVLTGGLAMVASAIDQL